MNEPIEKKRRDPVPESAKYFLNKVQEAQGAGRWSDAFVAMREAYSHLQNAAFYEAENADMLLALRNDVQSLWKELTANVVLPVGSVSCRIRDILDRYPIKDLPPTPEVVAMPKPAKLSLKAATMQRFLGEYGAGGAYYDMFENVHLRLLELESAEQKEDPEVKARAELWKQVKGLFHEAWGQAKESEEYNKDVFNTLNARLLELEDRQGE